MSSQGWDNPIVAANTRHFKQELQKTLPSIWGVSNVECLGDTLSVVTLADGTKVIVEVREKKRI